MLWCPKCKYEYRSGFTTCSNCGGALEERSEPEKKPEANRLEQPLDLRLLTLEYDRTFLTMIQNALADAGIASCIQEYHSYDCWLRNTYGFSFYGQCIYVEAQRLEEAREIMRAYFPGRWIAADGERPIDARLPEKHFSDENGILEDEEETPQGGPSAFHIKRRKWVRTLFGIGILVSVAIGGAALLIQVIKGIIACF